MTPQLEEREGKMHLKQLLSVLPEILEVLEHLRLRARFLPGRVVISEPGVLLVADEGDLDGRENGVQVRRGGEGKHR
jgi:hypothetical protein